MDYLLSSGGNLQDAAYTAGFYDAAHFSKHFKKFFGIAP
ncbi:MAG: helix-turn-helix domain-containing protein [Bacteroidota bacterium]